MRLVTRLFISATIILTTLASNGQDAIIFKDQFQNMSQWQCLDESVSPSVSGGKLSVSNNSGSATKVMSFARFYKHQNVQIDFKYSQSKDDPNTGILLGDVQGNEYFLFAPKSESSARLTNISWSNKSEISTASSTPSPGVMTSFSIKKAGSQISFFMNGSKLFSSTASGNGTFQYGLQAGNNVDISLSDLEITWDDMKVKNVPGSNEEAEKINLGSNINSKYNDLAPVISPEGDKLYFTRKGDPINIGEGDNDDAWMAESDGADGWNKAIHISKAINDENHNHISTALEKDGNFFVTGQYSGEGKEIDDLYMISRGKPGTFGKPSKIKIKDYENKWDFVSASMSTDEQVLIMTLKDDRTQGQSDLYISTKDGGSWTAPVPLPKSINTPGIEMTPFLAPDNRTLYFSSDGHPGYGSADIYVTRRQGGGWSSWSAPENMGPYINGTGWDAYFSVSKIADFGYLCSSKDAIGGVDIYKIKLPKGSTPDAGVVLKGVTYDSTTLEPMQAKVIIKERYTDSTIAELKSDKETGYYEQVLDPGFEYEVIAEQRPFNGDNAFVNTLRVKQYQEFVKDLYLTKFDEGAKIQLDKLHFYQSKPELLPECYVIVDELATILKENPRMKIRIEGHTDNQGSADVNLELSKDRTAEIKKMLVDRGIEEKRLKTKGYGEARPIASNYKEETRKLNRRVEFVVISNK
jgi:outer membrane protein OmpA-like peptidoglycan-associated protein